MASHESTLLSKRAKWLDPSTKTYVPGLLVLQQTRIRWEATVAGTAAPVTVPLSATTTTQRAKGKPFLRLMPSATVFEFESEADRDMAVDVLETAKRQLGGGAAAVGGQVIAGLSKADRDALLKDPDLVELHTALVGGGAVNEEEFWGGLAQRRGSAAPGRGTGGTAAQAHGGAKQRRGLCNAMKGVQHEVDGRHNTMTLNITKEMINQVFAEKPHVLRSHQQHVPHDMTDNEFWSRYARHELAKEAKRKRRLAGGATDDLTDEHADMFDDRLTGADKRRVNLKVRRVDPTVNLAANFDDGMSSGFGIGHNPSKEMGLPGGACGMADDLLRDINRHGEVVLQGVDALQQQQHQLSAAAGRGGHAASTSAAAAADGAGAAGEDNDGPSEEDLRRVMERNGGALDDLRARPREAREVLNIQDPSRYFDRMQQPVAAAKVEEDDDDDEETVGCTARQALRRLQTFDPQRLADPPMNTGLAFKVLGEVSRGAQAGHDLDSYGQPTRPPGEVLDGAILGMIRAKVLAINEILRHFWAALPGSAPPRVQKLDRLKTAMDAKGDEIESLQRATHGADRAYVRQLLRPARDALEAALTRFDADVAARRTVQAG